MYENSATYTWWDIEDGVGPLAIQAVDRWEALDLPKDAAENPAVLRVWETHAGKIAYTIALFYGDVEVYTAEGCIEIPEHPRRVAAAAVESEIFESSSDLIGETASERLVEGLLLWLRQR